MSINERLQMVIKMNGMTNSSFADRIGVQRSSVSHVLSGRNKPSIDFIQKILDTFPKVDANWLVAGRMVGKTSSDTIVKDNEEKIEMKNLNYDQQNEDRKIDINQQPIIDKRIQKVVIFYSDGTYEEMNSNN